LPGLGNGDSKDFKNYREITSLQSIPKKFFTKLRQKRCTICQLFTVRQILKSKEHKQKVLVNFIGLKQAFDNIWHDGMWIVMQNEGMPEQVIKSNVLQNTSKMRHS